MSHLAGSNAQNHATASDRFLRWVPLALLILAAGPIVAVGVVTAIAHAKKTRPAAPSAPAMLGKLAAFTLTERSGRPVTLEDLSGNVWVADFIFTRCRGPCPLMTHTMSRLAKNLPAEIRLVSFTVDPDWDSPEVLRQYAQRHEAEPERWWFLTGPRNAIEDLVRNGFRLAVRKTPEDSQNPILHDTHFVLVDKKGQIRGYYDSSDPKEIQKLHEDVRALESSSAE